MKTAKSLGLVKSDFIVTEAGFPAILAKDLNTATPMAEVWGFYQECGSVYAERCRKITKTEFLDLCQRHGHNAPLSPHTEEAKKALAGG